MVSVLNSDVVELSSKLVYKDVAVPEQSYGAGAIKTFTCGNSGYYQAFATIIGATNSSNAVQFTAHPSCSGYWIMRNNYTSNLTCGFTVRCFFIKP